MWCIIKGRPIETKVDKVVGIVKAMCILHNIIIDKEGIDHNLIPIDQTQRGYKQMRVTGRATDEGKRVREQFLSTFTITE